MSNENSFQYTYSAPENQEVLNIRNKYLPRQESGMDELRRLDSLVQSSGTMEGLILGIGGCLVFGLGMCFAMHVIGNALWLGVLLGLTGMAGMLFAYPVRRKVLAKAKQKYVPRILELAAELSAES